MTAALRTEYSRLRHKGWDASRALSGARTNVRFAELEEKGLVRLVADPDPLPYDDSYLDTWDDVHPNRIAQERRRLDKWLAEEGCYVVRAQHRCQCCGAWIDDDCVGGFIGDDWQDSGYDQDLRNSAMDALTTALDESIEVVEIK